jgi:putative pyruvate formate lyase activating enzyme
MPACHLCPRDCGRSRTLDDPGFCGASEPAGFFRVAQLMAHRWEEPCISGSRGSGTVFFSGCSLRCSFCQNYAISLQGHGFRMSLDDLADAMAHLASEGVHNFNLVTPSHYADQIPGLITKVRQVTGQNRQRALPVIWNSGGYETEASILGLTESVDVFMPDLKYFDPDLSAAVAAAPDYFDFASKAVLTMHHLQPNIVFDSNGLLQKGLLIRHLVLPGHWQDSCRIIDFLAANLPPDIPLSLLSQYTPQPQLPKPHDHPEFTRRLLTLEYQKVTEYALDKGFRHIIGQARTSADARYTPEFPP